MSTKKICWRGSDGDSEPVKCTYEQEFGHPNYCKLPDGSDEKMYNNTHFMTEDEAWKKIKDSMNAELDFIAGKLKEAKANLRQQEIKATEAVERRHRIKSNPKNPYKDSE